MENQYEKLTESIDLEELVKNEGYDAKISLHDRRVGCIENYLAVMENDMQELKEKWLLKEKEKLKLTEITEKNELEEETTAMAIQINENTRLIG